MTANGYGVSFCSDESVLKLGGHGGTTLNIQKVTELYTLKE